MKNLGIITGSGPEAGIDLWQKVLVENKKHHGESFSGDLQVPNTFIHSISELGHSLELPKHEALVWSHLKDQIMVLDQHCDLFAIACNTLHYFEPKIRELKIQAEFISIVACTHRHLQKHKINRFAILGIRIVADVDNPYSPFFHLQEHFEIEKLSEEILNDLQALVADIKVSSIAAEHNNTFNQILNHIHSEHCYLACTELPLLNPSTKEKTLIDTTQLLAEALIEKVYS